MKTLPLMALLLVLLPCVHCGEGGTETGNPQSAPSDGGDTGGEDNPAAEPFMNQLASDQILKALCDKLTACPTGLTAAECETGILAVTNIDTEIGLTAGQFASYDAIVEAELSGTVERAAAATSQCLADTGALACNSQSVAGAYSTADPDNFNNVAGMIPQGESSCTGVF